MNQISQFLDSIGPQIDRLLALPLEEKYKLPLNAPTIGSEEVLAVLRCFLEQRVTMGPKVAEFEAEFARYVGKKHALMVNSGSSANLLMIEALRNPLASPEWRLQPGDEVIVPAVTWSTTITPVINAGFIPVLVDADPKTLCMDVAAVEKAIGPKTKAVFVAHILGNSVDLGPIKALCGSRNLVLIEDSCEALGTTYDGQMTGAHGLAGSYSFYFSHHITTVEGGMIVTDDDHLAEVLRMIRAHGWTRHLKDKHKFESQYPHLDNRFLFINTGFNVRSTDINAVMGLQQLKKLSQFNQRRIEIAKGIMNELGEYKEQIQFIEPTAKTYHTWFGFPFLLTGDWSKHRQEFVRLLEENGIECRPIVAGNLAEQPFLKHFPHRIGGSLKGAEQIMRSGVYIGSHPQTTDDQIRHIKTVFKNIFSTRPNTESTHAHI